MSQRNGFDTLRLTGSLMVLVGHAFLITGSGQRYIGTIPLHSFGVCIFFAISGYLITQSWMSDDNLQRFLLRRVLRIIPALVAVSAFTALVIGAWATTETLGQYYRHGWTWRYIVSNSVLITVWGLPHVFMDLPIQGQSNGSLWTLPVEFSLYLLTPILFFLYNLQRNIVPAMIIALSVLVSALSELHLQAFSYSLMGINVGWGLAAAPYFWIGCALRLANFTAWTAVRRRIAVTLSILVIALWIASDADALLPLAIAPITIVTLDLGLRNWFHSRLIDRIGDLSYGIYLWSFPIQQLVMEKIGGGVVTNLAIALPSTILVAYGSWHLIERQALRLKPRRRTHVAEELEPASSERALQSPT